MRSPIVNVRDLIVSYAACTPLRNVYFQCRDDEFVCLVGKSGAGKSTFLKALAGFIPHQGLVEAPDRIGYVFQDHAVFPWMTVAENIAFGLHNLERDAKNNRVAEMLRRIDMEDLAASYPAKLSGGQVQRVALARAMAPEPDLILMDEPFGALDAHTRERMQIWIASVLTGAKAVIFVTHSIEEALFLGDRIVFLQDGCLNLELAIPFSKPRQKELRYTSAFTDLKVQALELLEK